MQATTRREPIRVNAVLLPRSRSSTIHTTKKGKSIYLLHIQRSKSSKWIMTEMPAFKLGVLPLALRSASSSAKEIITRSTTRRVITIPVPASPPSLSTPSSLHANEIHLVLFIWEVVETGHSQGTDEGFHSDRPNGVEEVVQNGSRAIARV
jgi:hypothetical protein